MRLTVRRSLPARLPALLLAALCVAGPACAQVYGVVRWPGTEVLDKPRINGSRVLTLKAADQVEILERGTFWWQVRAQGKTGWTPALIIEPVQASVPAAAAATLNLPRALRVHQSSRELV